MKDLKNILTEYSKIDLTQRKVALATVVRVRGSAYRSPGARMLITDDGRWVGSISGGCLEGDALRKARKVMLDKKPLIVTYDTSEEGNQNLGIGLGCNGIIDVLIEPVDESYPNNPIPIFKKIQDVNEPVALATVFNDTNQNYVGGKLLVSNKCEVLNKDVDDNLRDVINIDLQQLFKSKKSETKTYFIEGNEIEVFIELVQPTISIIIFGGGFDARPVSHLAKSLGWNVTVTDECVAHIAPVYFPTADKLSLCHREFVEKDFNITPYTACVLMSHNYEYDKEVLKKILILETPYIGILGPRKRFEKMLDEFTVQKVSFKDHEINRVYSPIGLDIGAETPEEIAAAIISEVLCVFSNRQGSFLRNRNEPIHHREGEEKQVFKEAYGLP